MTTSFPRVRVLHAPPHRCTAWGERQDQLSRVIALAGALLINLALLFGGMLWPTSRRPLSQRDETMDALEVRFIDKSLMQARSPGETPPSANRVTNTTADVSRASPVKRIRNVSEAAAKSLASAPHRSAMPVWDAKGSAGHGGVASYIQARPQASTDVMARARGRIKYRSTRFDQAWTSKSESSVDTVVRRAIERTTIRWTITLPRSLRIHCAGGPGTPDSAMNALPLLSFGCHGDPPPPPVASDALARVQTMAPAKPLAENPPPNAEAVVTVAPIRLDNAALCATARVAHAPPSSGCEVNVQAVSRTPNVSNSWLPARDPAAIKNPDAKRK